MNLEENVPQVTLVGMCLGGALRLPVVNLLSPLPKCIWNHIAGKLYGFSEHVELCTVSVPFPAHCCAELLLLRWPWSNNKHVTSIDWRHENEKSILVRNIGLPQYDYQSPHFVDLRDCKNSPRKRRLQRLYGLR